MAHAIVRADASPAIGGGHIVRSLALVGALAARGWRCALACRPGTADVVPWALADVAEVFELGGPAEAEAAALREHWPRGCDLLIVDHYQRDARFEHACRPWAGRILAIDDLADRSHDCDMLVDSAYGRTPEPYRTRVPPAADLLLGTAYCLLRPQFAQQRFARPTAETATRPRVFVGIGATDPHDATSLCLEALAKTGVPLSVDVVLGRSAPHLSRVERLVADLPLEVTIHVNQPNIAPLMAKADLTIGAGGSAAWERCCLGVANVLLSTASNQDLIARVLSAQDAAEVVSFASVTVAGLADLLARLLRDPRRRQALGANAARLCDGLGAARVADAVDAPRARDGAAVRLRPATMDDAELLLGWQQTPGVRRYFRNPAAPAADTHRQWLAAKLSDTGCLLQLVLHGGEPAGMVRLDRLAERSSNDPSFEVSILVAPERQGLGLGTAALLILRRMMPWARLVADVHPGNAASAALFRRAGFVPAAGDAFVAPASTPPGR